MQIPMVKHFHLSSFCFVFEQIFIVKIAYAGGNYEYGQYYPAMNAGMVDNGAGQTSGNPTDHELDNRHGKAKTTILADSLYHPYARN